MKRFKKLKLQNRISLIYIILFLFLMVVSNLLIIYLVQRGNNKPLEVAFKERKVLVEEFFTKIESYSNQYDNLVLEFNPKSSNCHKFLIMNQRKNRFIPHLLHLLHLQQKRWYPTSHPLI